jgi:carbon monoxide dehydrogenase subunit G
MIEVTASGHVPSTPDRVWELICDTSRLAEWVAATEAVTRADGPAGPGVTYDEVNPIFGPWKARSRWRVTEFDPPRRQVHHGEGLPLTRDFAVIMEVAPDGLGSRVTLTLQGTPGAGPLGALFARLMRPQVDRDNRRSLANLTELARREGGAPPAAG